VVSMVRVVIAGLILATAFPLGGFADQMSPLAQFATGMAAIFAVSFVLPHYFYRGEPLLPDRHKKKR
jgi:hypothetical protein